MNECVGIYRLTAIVWLVRIKLALQLLPYRKVLHRVHMWTDICRDSGPKLGYSYGPDKICRFVTRSAKVMPFAVGCLPKALCGYVLCRRHGYQVDLKIGVKHQKANQIAAHAWLTWGDKIVLGDQPDLDSYSVFEDISSQGFKI